MHESNDRCLGDTDPRLTDQGEPGAHLPGQAQNTCVGLAGPEEFQIFSMLQVVMPDLPHKALLRLAQSVPWQP
jgi:hypothetical protein